VLTSSFVHSRLGVCSRLCPLHQDLDHLRALPPDDERYKEIPPKYYLAYPLDDESRPRGTAGAIGYPSVLYKVSAIGFPDLTVS
jgi:hypothetical protein